MYICIYVYMYICIYVYMYIRIYVAPRRPNLQSWVFQSKVFQKRISKDFDGFQRFSKDFEGFRRISKDLHRFSKILRRISLDFSGFRRISKLLGRLWPSNLVSKGSFGPPIRGPRKALALQFRVPGKPRASKLVIFLI